MVLGLLEPSPDLLVRGTGTDPAPSIIKQKQYEKPWSLLFLKMFSLKKDVNVALQSNKQETYPKHCIKQCQPIY